MLIVGLDFFKTITANPKIFRRLATILIAQGCPVYIITAVQSHRVAIVKDLVKKSKVPHTGLEIVVFKELDEIPQLKLETCKRLGVRLMIDDMPEVVSLLKKHHILALQVI